MRVVLAAATGGVNDVLTAAKTAVANAVKLPPSSSATATASSKDDSRGVVEALAASGARVLIVHGDSDAIVPVANSRRLGLNPQPYTLNPKL